MNSKKLISLHEQQYKEFFAQHEIICSVPFSINRADDRDVQGGGVSIKQKIPLRMYIGAKKSSKQHLVFDSVTYYDQFTGLLVRTSLSEYLPYIGEVEENLSELYDPGLSSWYTFSLFCELPRNVGLWFDACFSVLVAAMIARLRKYFSQAVIDEYRTKTIQCLVYNTQSPYSQLIEHAEALESIISGQKWMSWYGFSCLQDGAYPIISFVWWDTVLGRDEIVYYVYKLNDLISLPDSPYVAHDYGIIFSGDSVIPPYDLHAFKERYDYLMRVTSVCKDAFCEDIQAQSVAKRPLFYTFFLNSQRQNDFIYAYQRLLWSASLELYYILTKIYSKSVSIKDIQAYVDLLNTMWLMGSMLRKPSSDMEHVTRQLSTMLNKKLTSAWFLCADMCLSGGSLVFALLSQDMKNVLYESIAEIQKDKPHAQILYTTRTDGLEYKGIHFDQDLEHDILSMYMKPYTLCLQALGWSKMYGDYEYMVEHAACDIIIDTVYMKLYVCWQKTTSKDLHTQAGTVELLSYLLKHDNREIMNNELPSSAYSKNKNDMNGKVILPLINLVKERIWKELPLRASWSLYEFSIRLGTHDVSIGVLSKCL